MATGTREHPLNLVQFPFSAGIDEGTRDEVVEAGAGWAVLENGRQDHVGGYNTRNGFAALPLGLIDGSSPTNAYRLFADERNIVRIADGTAQAFDLKSGKWISLGRVPECSANEVDLPSMGVSSTLEDQAYCNGYICIGWNANAASTYAFYGVVNATTWATVRAPEQLVTSSNIAATLVGTYGAYFIAVVADSGGTIKAWYLDTTSSTTIAAGWVSIGTIAADYATFTFNGAAIHSLADRIAVLYVNTVGGTSRATVKTFNIGGVIASTTVNTSSITPLSTEVMGSIADTLWLSWNENLNVRVMGVDGTTLATTSTVATIVVVTTSASTIGMAQSATTGAGRILVTDVTSMIARDFSVSGGATTGGAAQVRIPAATPAGRPTQYLGRYYVPVFGGQQAGLSQNDQKTCILVDFTNNVTTVRPIANVAPGLAVVSTYHKGKTSAGLTSSKLYFGYNLTRSSVANASALAEYDFADLSRWTPVAFGNSMFLTGGMLSYSDGSRVAENGFLIRPTIPLGALSGVGITGTFRYVCIYEEVDADGNWCVSGLSTPSAVVTAANNTVTVTTLPLSISARLGSVQNRSVRVAFYRTATGGVAPYYRLGTTINDTSLATVTFTDAVTDATLTANAKLYAQPGVLNTSQDRRAPSGLSLLTSYNGMLVGATGSNVFTSGQNVSGEGAWFNPVFQTPVPGAGDITALAVMDGTLFVFKRREVFAMAGDAPSDNGSSGGLGYPRRLASDVGSISPVTCTTALGIFFQSDRGIEVLTRAQVVDWIGQPLQDTETNFPLVTAMTVDPASCTILVECAATSSLGLITGNGRTLIYDLSLKTWVSVDRRESVTGTTSAPAQSACLVYTTQNVASGEYRYAWLSANGYVHIETNAFTDADGSFVCKRAVSAHVKASGLQGKQHINKTQVLAKYATAHDLSVTFAYDYGAYKPARIYTNAQLVALTALIPNMQLEHPMHDDATCEAVRVQLQDVTPSSGSIGTGQGSTWIALAFETVPFTGGYDLPDAAR